MTTAPPVTRIALFGGSFDPVHLGHVAIAGAALEQAGLDRLIFLPCWQSPHKERQPTAAGHRLAMLKLAAQNLESAEVCDWEVLRDEPSYSWMTARHFAGQHPAAELFWILGTDQWDAIERWAEPEILAETVTFIVFPRGNPVTPRDGFRHIAIDVNHPASSTQARARTAAGEPTEDLLNPLVADYIDAQGLYRN